MSYIRSEYDYDYERRYERPPQPEPSLGDLFGELSREASLLIRQEVQLAKVEMREKAQKAAKDIAFMIVGGMLANTALLALVAALILGIAEFTAAWLAALVVGVVILGVAAVFIFTGLNDLKQIEPTPETTIETLKEDKEWMKRQLA